MSIVSHLATISPSILEILLGKCYKGGGNGGTLVYFPIRGNLHFWKFYLVSDTKEARR